EYPTFNPVVHRYQYFVEKMHRVMCGNMEWDARGRSTCLCQDKKKDAPLLQDCNAYNGQNGNYEDVVSMTAELFLTPRNRQEVATLSDWLQRGLLSDIGDPILGPNELRSFLHATLNVVGVLPYDLYAFARVKERLNAMPVSTMQDLL